MFAGLARTQVNKDRGGENLAEGKGKSREPRLWERETVEKGRREGRGEVQEYSCVAEGARDCIISGFVPGISC